eukprot:gene7525-biopygen11426
MRGRLEAPTDRVSRGEHDELALVVQVAPAVADVGVALGVLLLLDQDDVLRVVLRLLPTQPHATRRRRERRCGRARSRPSGREPTDPTRPCWPEAPRTPH